MTHQAKDPKLWSHEVTHRPPATFPPSRLYTLSAEQMYLQMRRPDVSPNGLGSAIQMQIFFINRAGRNLPQERKNAIWLSVEYLRIELLHLNHFNRRVSYKNEKKVLEVLQNELAYSLLYKRLKLNKQPYPVYPPPPPEKRIGGRNGFNRFQS